MNAKAKSILVGTLTTLATMPAMAEEAGATHGGGLVALGAGLAIGLAALGGATGQGKAVASAMDGIARNPAALNKMFVPMIIGLAFMETLVIFSLIVAFQLVGKV